MWYQQQLAKLWNLQQRKKKTRALHEVVQVFPTSTPLRQESLVPSLAIILPI